MKFSDIQTCTKLWSNSIQTHISVLHEEWKIISWINGKKNCIFFSWIRSNVKRNSYFASFDRSIDRKTKFAFAWTRQQKFQSKIYIQFHIILSSLCLHSVFEGQSIVAYNFEYNLFTMHFIGGFFVCVCVQIFSLLFSQNEMIMYFYVLPLQYTVCRTQMFVSRLVLYSVSLSLSCFILVFVYSFFFRR